MTLKFSSNNKKDSASQFTTVVLSVCISVILSYFVNSKLEVSSQGGGVGDEQILSYIENNADKVVEALNNYYKKKAQADLANRDKLLKSSKDRLESKDHPSAGGKNAKVTVVEFFDYNCGYCKRAFPALSKAVQDDLDVKIVFIDFPILGAASEMKARASVAANLLDKSKYLDMHAKLMVAQGTTVEDMVGFAQEVGYNKEKFSKKINSEEVTKLINKNKNLARDLSINGTPAFIVNGKFFQGALSYDMLKKESSGK